MDEKVINGYSYPELGALLKNDTPKFLTTINSHFGCNISIIKEAELIAIYPPHGGIRSWNCRILEGETCVLEFNDYAVTYEDMVKKICLYLKDKNS